MIDPSVPVPLTVISAVFGGRYTASSRAEPGSSIMLPPRFNEKGEAHVEP